MANGWSDDQIEQLSGVLKQVPFFGDLRPEELRAIANTAQMGTYRAGSEIYRQSDVDNVLYVILSGRVALYHVDPAGVESFVGFRESGSAGWLGEASVLLGDA